MDTNNRVLLRLMHQPCTEENLNGLPLFNGKRETGISYREFHKSYYPDVSVTNLILNIRARTLLEKKGVRTIGELLLTSYCDLSRVKNCGSKTISGLQAAAKNYILDKTFNYSVYWRDLESMLRNVLPLKERNMKIFITRLGISKKAAATLEECGAQFGITREAVRQIISQIQDLISHPETDFKLRPFWSMIDKWIVKKEVMMSDDLASRLKAGLSWDTKPEPHALEHLLSLKSHKYSVTFNNLVGFVDSKCLNCDCLNGQLEKLMSNRTEITQNTVFQRFTTDFSKICPQIDTLPPRIVNALCKLYLKRFVSENPNYIFRNNKIINKNTYIPKKKIRTPAELPD